MRTRADGEARREAILECIARGLSNVDELSAQLGVSPSTVRRDLQRLALQGRATRTYGGAVLGQRPAERTLSEKQVTSLAEKRAIAAAAEQLVPAGATVILDAGTTVGHLAQRLTARADLLMVTNSVNAIGILAAHDRIDLVVLGGELRSTSQALLGTLTEEALAHISADVAFIGADGLVAGRGLCAPTLSQSHLKVRMAQHASRVCVLADHSKLGVDVYPFWGCLRGEWTLITDALATPAQLEPFWALDGCEVIVAAMSERDAAD